MRTNLCRQAPYEALRMAPYRAPYKPLCVAPYVMSAIVCSAIVCEEDPTA
ncbi:hypothetical protein [Streptomyces avermitilis]